jgi:hypothetical protein
MRSVSGCCGAAFIAVLLRAPPASAQPEIAVDPAGIEFGEVFPPASECLGFSVLNPGDATLTTTGFTITGADADQFELCGFGDPACDGQQQCDVEHSIGPGMQNLFGVACAPTRDGPLSAAVEIASDAADPEAGVVTLSCTGVGAGAPADVVVAPAALSFPPLHAEVETATRTLTITNAAPAGSMPLQYDLWSDAWDDATQFTVAGCAGAMPLGCYLDPGESAVVSVTFHPDRTNLFTDPVLVYTTDPDEPLVEIPLFAESGYPRLVIDVPGEHANLDLGSVPVGETTAPGTIVAHNDGPVPLFIWDVDSDNPEQVPIVAGPPPESWVAPGETVTWTVTCTPPSVGGFTAWITFDTNSNQGIYFAYVSCTGTGDAVAISPPAHDFGAVALPEVPEAAFELRNLGGAPLTVERVAIDAGAEFAAVGLAAGAVVPAGGSAPFVVRATPAVLGPRAATLTIDTDAQLGLTVPLAAIGTDPLLGVVTIDAAPEDYVVDAGRTDLDRVPETLSVFLHNLREQHVTLATCRIDGSPAFTFASPCPVSIPPRGVAQVRVWFHPAAEVDHAATLTLTSSAIRTTALVLPLTGLGVDQYVALSASYIQFPVTPPGGAVPPVRSVTLVNNGSEPLAISVTHVGAAFSLVSAASATVAPGASHEISVEFAPATAGQYTGRVYVGNADDPRIAEIALGGRSVGAAHLPGAAVATDAAVACAASSPAGGGVASLVLVTGAVVLVSRRRARGAGPDNTHR